MKHQGILLRGTAIALSLSLLFALGSVSCSRAPVSSMGIGNGTSVTPYSGGNPYTPVNPTATINTTNGTNSGTGGSGANGTFTPWDQSGALSVLNGINPINPAQSSVGSDLQNGIASLLQQASKNGAAAVEQDCSMYPDALTAIAHQCFNRYMLGGMILQQCSANLTQYKPLPGEPILGVYAATCPPIKGYTNGHIVATVGGDYPSYSLTYKFPHSCNQSGVSSAGDDIKFWHGGGAGYCSDDFTDLPSAATAKLHIQNSAAHYKCDAQMTQTSSNNPIPAKVAQGMKSLSDCYRKAMFMMSPLFDTMFNNMQGQNGQANPAMLLMLSAMNIGN